MNASNPPEADVKVSVAMITYNHERFIAQAIESVLMQQTDFPIELVIGEDCSTDATRVIVREFGERYPERIRLLFPERNLGMMPNFVATMQACRGQYIALLEGDDYWTDPRKLQKQVDFLECHPDCVSCFHNAKVLYQEGERGPHDHCLPSQKEFLTIEDLLVDSPIPTCSVLFRNGLVLEYPNWFYKTKNGDTALHILNSQFGQIGYINEVMAVFRRHTGGAWSGLDAVERQKGTIRFSQLVASELSETYRPILREHTLRQYEVLGAILARRATDRCDDWSRSRRVTACITFLIDAETAGLDLDEPARKKISHSFYPALLFAGHGQGISACVRYALPRAIKQDFSLLTNRGVWSIAAQAFLGAALVRRLRAVAVTLRTIGTRIT